MIETAKGIPKFNELGNLPHKCYEVTLEDIKEKLVDDFPNSKTRVSRFECFLRFYNELVTNVKSCSRLLINGSFVRNIDDPYDIDFVIVIDSKKLTNEEHIYLNQIINIKNKFRAEYDYYKELYEQDLISKESLYQLDLFKFGCEFFRMDKLYEPHPMYDKYLEKKEYWIDWWGHDRDKNPKGFLDLKILNGGELSGT